MTRYNPKKGIRIYTACNARWPSLTCKYAVSAVEVFSGRWDSETLNLAINYESKQE